MNIFISKQQPARGAGWICHYNKSEFWWANKRMAVACAKELTSQKNMPFKARVLPASLKGQP
jgi:hypothetical protein